MSQRRGLISSTTESCLKNMLTPEIIHKLSEEYKLEIGMVVVVPDGREGRLINVRFNPDVGVVQFLGEDHIFYRQSFPLGSLKQLRADI